MPTIMLKELIAGGLLSASAGLGLQTAVDIPPEQINANAHLRAEAHAERPDWTPELRTHAKEARAQIKAEMHSERTAMKERFKEKRQEYKNADPEARAELRAEMQAERISLREAMKAKWLDFKIAFRARFL